MKILNKIFYLIILTSLSGCFPIKPEGFNKEYDNYFSDFYNHKTEEKNKEYFLNQTIEKQYEIMVYGRNKIHPPLT